MSSITNSYSSSLYSSYYQNLKDSNTNKTTSTNVSNNVNLVNQDSKTTLPSDKEILSVINNQAQFYQQAWKNINYTTDNLFAIETSRGCSIFKGGTMATHWDMHFKDTIENKLKLNKGSNITQQDAENAQKFLFEQMDNIMLTLYKENPELMQETMEKSNQFYASNQLTGDASYHLSDYYQSLGIDEEKISALLLDYGARTESQKLEEAFSNYFGSVSGILKNF
ncbi:MAG: hypothetical protein K2N75_04810 [Helicobacter sp.]|uniref:hypothetical protein n=1 Tax=Helicobacter sp. TaxID=218 RepID=UPI0023BD6830|nr:hypothetical protein [Helicobacter sp.]MDE5925554.1 hypothetical protein [Helicobacter sp.]MDE7175346.1 hypothetical protein [Helicobacter sp.]